MTSVRERAISAFKKANPQFDAKSLLVSKARAKREIIVTVKGSANSLRWSYADAGKLRRI